MLATAPMADSTTVISRMRLHEGTQVLGTKPKILGGGRATNQRAALH
jgi:hypothetical protein